MNLSDSVVTVDDLDAAARRSVMIAILWRGFVVNLLVIVVGGLGGFLVGFLFSLVAALVDVVPGPAYRNLAVGLSTLTGFIVGLYASWQYIRWLFPIGRLPLAPDSGRLVRYNDPISRVIRILLEQLAVPTFPLSRVEILPHLLQPRFGSIAHRPERRAA